MAKNTVKTKKTLSIVMLFATILTSMFTLFTVPASATTSGKVDSSTYCTVQVSDKLLTKWGKQYAKVKINVTDKFGHKDTSKIRVTLRDQYGNYITSFVTKGGSTIKLGDDHRVYRIYVQRYTETPKNNWLSRAICSGNNFMNSSPTNWSVTNAKNCSVW